MGWDNFRSLIRAFEASEVVIGGAALSGRHDCVWYNSLGRTFNNLPREIPHTFHAPTTWYEGESEGFKSGNLKALMEDGFTIPREMVSSVG